MSLHKTFILTLSLASGLRIICARWAIAPASTTVWANSGECLQMSLNADAAIRLRLNSGSWMQRTSRGTAPASTTDWANSEEERKQSFHGRIYFGDLLHLENMQTEKNASNTTILFSVFIQHGAQFVCKYSLGFQ